MKVKNRDIFRTIIYLSAVLMVGYLRIFSVAIGSYNIGLFVVLLNLIPILLIVTRKVKCNLEKFVKTYLIIYLFVLIIEVINTKNKLHYSSFDLLKSFIPYLYIYISLVLIYVFENNGLKRTLSIISEIVTGILILKAISWICYTFLHIEIFPQLLFQYRGWIRDGYQRIDTGCLFFIAVVWDSYLAFKMKQRKGYVKLAFYFFFSLFIARYRFLLSVVIVTVFAVFYYSKNRSSTKLVIKVLVVVGVLAVLALGLYSRLVELFSVNGVYGSSTFNRMRTLYHYLDIMSAEKAWLGLGMLESTIEGSRDYMLLATGSNGASYFYWIDDIGIIGGVVRFGILSIIVYIPLFYKAITTFLKVKKDSIEELPLLAGICTFMILSCTVLNFFDSQRAFDTPFYLALICYSGWGHKSKTINNNRTIKHRQHNIMQESVFM